ncbi:MAG: hypothetical protein IIT69_03075 [Bacteroidales bacterium]|jgi:hypothetical protein|nr:hypothetical protein [Bacteroidales bacterium]MBQ6301051.1 hypothetical protein [Bacteroidales bacterium]MEE3476027.1 hypothetical protein [Candidatus Cryptobacteroides sp.]
MLKGNVRRILLIAFSLLCVLPLSAQNEAYNSYSPYSMFGIGDISRQGSAYNKSMGGVGIATRDKRALNYLNPAAVTARDKKTFMADFSLAQGNRYYKQGDMSSSNNTFNIYDVAFSFPVYKSLAMYAGFSPFSDLGYKISSKETGNIISQTGVITNTVQGYGGLSEVFLGAGLTPFKGFSIGAEGQYYFGKLNKNSTFDLASTGFRDIYSGYEMHLKSYSGKFGVQYETPAMGNVTAVIGATYRLKSNFSGHVDRYEIQTISSINDSTPSPRTFTDTLGKRNRVGLAQEIGAGFSLRGNKWTAEVNYLRSDWSSCGLDNVPGFACVGSAVFSATTSQSVRAGFSYVPNRNDIRYYRRRVTYRAGAYWDQAYYKVDGSNINAFGLTFGATLPVFSNRTGVTNGLTVGIDIGQRGSTAGNLVRERYINFNIGLNLLDIWFLKPRYD